MPRSIGREPAKARQNCYNDPLSALVAYPKSLVENSPGQPTGMGQIFMGEDLEEFRKCSIEVGDEGAWENVLELTDCVSR